MVTYCTWGTSRSSKKSSLEDAPGGYVWACVASLLGHFISSRTQFCTSGSRWDTGVWLQWILPATTHSAETLFPSGYWRRPLVKQQFPSCSHPLQIPICHSTIPMFWVLYTLTPTGVRQLCFHKAEVSQPQSVKYYPKVMLVVWKVVAFQSAMEQLKSLLYTHLCETHCCQV